MRILTVGDGDLSLSTALTRAYPSIDVTATSLLDNKEQLLKVYPNAVIEELEQKSAAILYGIDATQLHRLFNEDSFDLVVFHHPHLGDYDERDEGVHRQRHYCLLVHYLASASVISPRVHVALCGSQHLSWRLGEAAEKAGLKQSLEFPVSKPFHQLFSNFDESSIQVPSFSKRAMRKKTASKHWLVKYGYKHQRTFLTGPPVDLSGSKHYVFERSSYWKFPLEKQLIDMTTTCTLCELDAGCMNALKEHWRAPSLPVPLQPNRTSEDIQGASLHTNINNTSCGGKVSKKSVDQCAERSSTIALDITSEYDGKRIRWYLQHKMNYSKRQAQDYISTGKIQVNGHPVLDSSRILRQNDRIEVEETIECPATSSIKIRVVERWNDHTLVVWKPVGMRCKDTAGSLDAVVSLQEGRGYGCVTKLDTGCSGLCLLVALPLPNPLPDVQHTFTALIHGKPDLNETIEIPFGELRRWKNVQSNDSVSASIQRLEQTDDLSTISITLSTVIPSVTNVICYYFRKTVGCPVVGDRFASQEYLTLPRFLRNRLKHRLCFMCTAIRSIENHTEVSVPEKLQALHWKTFASAENQDTKEI